MLLRFHCIAAIIFGMLVTGSVTLHAADVAGLAESQQWKMLQQQLTAGASANIAQPDGATALHWAAYHNHEESARQLLAAGAKVDAATQYSVTPLSLACEYGSAGTAAVLIAAKANVEAARAGKETPLMLAARSGSVSIVKQLLSAGAKVDAQEANNQTALMWAAAAGNTAVVDSLIKGGADIHHRLPGSDLSAFMFAARQGKTGAAFRLLEAGADINAVVKPKRRGGRHPRAGMSALLFAVESGHLGLALKLVEKGADPNDQRSGFTPLHALTWVRRAELGDNPRGDPAPRITGGVTSLDFAEAIIKAGAKVNLQLAAGSAGRAKLNPKGATPFLLAAKNADIPLMRLLLKLGADPQLTNTVGTNALMAAAGVGVISVGEEPGTPEEVDTAIQMLVDLGIDPNVVDKNGETAMHGAAYRTFPSAVAKLAEVGADPQVWDRKNRHGWTPLAIAGGKRPGSVKPSPPTIEALNAAMK